MLHFNEIKKDYADDFGFMEYEGTWYGYDYNMTMAGDSLLIHIRDADHECYHELPIDSFISMSYDRFTKYLDGVMYYNMQEVEQYDECDFDYASMDY